MFANAHENRLARHVAATTGAAVATERQRVTTDVRHTVVRVLVFRFLVVRGRRQQQPVGHAPPTATAAPDAAAHAAESPVVRRYAERTASPTTTPATAGSGRHCGPRRIRPHPTITARLNSRVYACFCKV